MGQAQPQISSRARSAGLVPQAPLPSSPLPCTLNSLGGGDDTGMPVRARGDESHSDVLLPKVWSPQPRTALREGQRGSRAPTGELSQSEILRNARKLLRYSSGWSWRQLSTTGGSTQEPRVSGAGHSSSQDPCFIITMLGGLSQPLETLPGSGSGNGSWRRGQSPDPVPQLPGLSGALPLAFSRLVLKPAVGRPTKLSVTVPVTLISHLVLTCSDSLLPTKSVWTVAHQSPLSMGSSRQAYWSG